MDTRFKREERSKIIDDFVHGIGKLYGVQVAFTEDVWSDDDDETPLPGCNCIQLKVFYGDDGRLPDKNKLLK